MAFPAAVFGGSATNGVGASDTAAPPSAASARICATLSCSSIIFSRACMSDSCCVALLVGEAAALAGPPATGAAGAPTLPPLLTVSDAVVVGGGGDGDAAAAAPPTPTPSSLSLPASDANGLYGGGNTTSLLIPTSCGEVGSRLTTPSIISNRSGCMLLIACSCVRVRESGRHRVHLSEDAIERHVYKHAYMAVQVRVRAQVCE
jgi:hypothetical protein